MLSFLLMFIVVECFYNIVSNIFGTLCMKRIIVFDKPAVDKSLSLQPTNKFRRSDFHFLCCCLYSYNAELHYITFMCAWTTFHTFMFLYIAKVLIFNLNQQLLLAY